MNMSTGVVKKGQCVIPCKGVMKDEVSEIAKILNENSLLFQLMKEASKLRPHVLYQFMKEATILKSDKLSFVTDTEEREK